VTHDEFWDAHRELQGAKDASEATARAASELQERMRRRLREEMAETIFRARECGMNPELLFHEAIGHEREIR
jgi:hypothetical protein